MKGGKYSVFGAVTLEKGKLDLSQKQSTSSPELATGGGIGKKINHGGRDGGDDDGDDDDGEGEEGGLFRRRMFVEEGFECSTRREISRLAWLGIEVDPLVQLDNLLNAYNRPSENGFRSSSKWFISKNAIISSLGLLGIRQGNVESAADGETGTPKAHEKRILTASSA